MIVNYMVAMLRLEARKKRSKHDNKLILGLRKWYRMHRCVEGGDMVIERLNDAYRECGLV
jgi:hypothetical protein